MADRAINAAAVWVKSADSDVIKRNKGGKGQHHQQMHAAVVTGVEKSYAENVSNAGSPVTIEDRSASKPAQNAGPAYGKFHKLIKFLPYCTKKVGVMLLRKIIKVNWLKN
jgi:hypothetical protein